MNGQAVHAKGGRRSQYQPIQSILHTSSEPISLARAIRHSLKLQTLYLADLDAIRGGSPRIDIARAIIAAGFQLWIDAGVRDVPSLGPLLELDAASTTIIVGLETVAGPRELSRIVARAGAERVIFSLDLFDGRPRIAAPSDWVSDQPLALADSAIDRGVHQLLVLDLARVGMGRGPGTNDLLTRIHDDHPSVNLTVGGGVARISDVLQLRAAGASSVLVGSAIHDGRIGLREIETLTPDNA